MLIRALSGSVYVALIVLTCVFTRLGFDILMLFFAIVGIYEFSQITSQKDVSMSTRLSVLSLDISAVMCTVLLTTAIYLDYPLTSVAALDSVMIFIGLFVLLLVLYTAVRVCYALLIRTGNPTQMLSNSLLGIVYLSVGLCSAIVLNALSNGLVLIVFIFIWLNDTGAYLTGRTFGRHKLCVHLSPKKTFEGFIGGVVFCIVVGVIFFLPVLVVL